MVSQSEGPWPRRRPRLRVSLPVAVTGVNAANRVFSEDTRTVNVSGGGIGFLSRQALEIGGRLRLAIDLPEAIRRHFGGRYVYRVRAVICRVERLDAEDGWRIGARFLAELSD